jgi:tetratricopeptide (TPR) repeat protein
VDRTNARDVRQEMPAQLDAHTAVAGAERGSAAGPLVGTTASDQVVVGDIPAERPGFQPRPALLAQLDPADHEAPVVQVLTGPQGVGKTQLAAAYARARLAAGWRLVAWINTEDADRLQAGLAAAADAVGLSDAGSRPGPADAGRALRSWLEADGSRCLLAFDEVADPETLRPFLPAAGAARVLITAAGESVASLGTGVPVDVLSKEEALALLDGRTGLADEAGAAAVAAELGYLPLALDQAAAVIVGQYMGYASFLERLRAVRAEDDSAPEEEQPDPGCVAETVLLSLEAAQAADQAGVGVGVLEVMAVQSAVGVRRGLLHAAGQAGALAAGGRRVPAAVVDQVLARLAEQALLTFTVNGQVVMMHRLVARVIRERMARQNRLAVVCRAAASALGTYAEALAGLRDHSAMRDIAGQVAALLEHATGPAIEADEDLARLLLRPRFLALYHLIELGDNMPRAIAVGEPLTADFERLLGPDHPDTLNAVNSLAAAYQAAGRAAEAIPLFEQTLVGRVRLLGPDHPDTLTSQNNLAATYQDADRTVEAILLFRLTLAARERLLGADHPSTVNSRGNLAAAYRDVGRTAEAIPLFEETLAGRERLLGPDHPDTLRSRNSLAAAYKTVGRAADAIPLLEKTLVAREQALGADHPKTLGSRNNLAAAYREAGRATEAVPLLEETLAACERLLGADDPRTRAVRHNLPIARQEASQPQ